LKIGDARIAKAEVIHQKNEGDPLSGSPSVDCGGGGT